MSGKYTKVENPSEEILYLYYHSQRYDICVRRR